jgi:hypothetical protein
VRLDHVGTTNIYLYFTFVLLVLLRIYRKISQDFLLSMDEVKTPRRGRRHRPGGQNLARSASLSLRSSRPKLARPRRILKAIAPARAAAAASSSSSSSSMEQTRTGLAKPRHAKSVYCTYIVCRACGIGTVLLYVYIEKHRPACCRCWFSFSAFPGRGPQSGTWGASGPTRQRPAISHLSLPPPLSLARRLYNSTAGQGSSSLSCPPPTFPFPRRSRLPAHRDFLPARSAALLDSSCVPTGPRHAAAEAPPVGSSLGWLVGSRACPRRWRDRRTVDSGGRGAGSRIRTRRTG